MLGFQNATNRTSQQIDSNGRHSERKGVTLAMRQPWRKRDEGPYMATLSGSLKFEAIISPVILSLLKVCGRRIMGTPTRSDLPANTS
jgi:hypothetical protein